MRKIILLLLFIISTNHFSMAQVEIKARADIYIDYFGAGYYYVNNFYKAGLIVDKRLGINKAVHTGIYFSGTAFKYIDRDNDIKTYVRDYTGYDGYIEGSYTNSLGEKLRGETGELISFTYVTVPIGVSYYLFPRLYLDYELHVNFLTNQPSLYYYKKDDDGMEKWKIPLEHNSPRSTVLGHTITINASGILKVIDFGIGVNIGSGSLIQDLPYSYDFMEKFREVTRKRGTLMVSAKINLFQIKRKKI